MTPLRTLAWLGETDFVRCTGPWGRPSPLAAVAVLVDSHLLTTKPSAMRQIKMIVMMCQYWEKPLATHAINCSPQVAMLKIADGLSQATGATAPEQEQFRVVDVGLDALRAWLSARDQFALADLIASVLHAASFSFVLSVLGQLTRVPFSYESRPQFAPPAAAAPAPE